MSTVGFRLATPSRGSGGKIPLTVERAIASGYAEAEGALLLINATNKFEACGADPALIAAVALTPGGADTSGFNILGRKEFPPLFMQGISLAGEHFIAPYLGTLPANPGGTYGVVRDSDGVWKVDFTDDVNVVLTYTRIPTFDPGSADGSGLNQLVIVEFLPTVIQPV